VGSSCPFKGRFDLISNKQAIGKGIDYLYLTNQSRK